MDTKTYIFTTGKHTDSEGKQYKKGDRIDLTKEQANGLANKVIDLEASYGITSDSSDNVALKERIAELELEVEQLKEAIGDEE